MPYALIAAALLAGYALGRYQPGPRLLSWAETATAPGWRTWKFWPAAPIIVAALAWIFAMHPRRTLANMRSWKNPTARGPAMTFNPHWKDNR
ncbi:hypothetical protein [Streptomyces sp. NPDC058297]|uniref:hypothetical protein n=1 Tax=Streptomyces sp. NPDC058297 TaxID=3346433 RepID=UPI0036F14CDD